MPTKPTREKNGKHLSLRSAKLGRAQQLETDYPRLTEAPLMPLPDIPVRSERLNILFVCSRNQWRSPTAEQIWRRHPALSVRSGGTSPNARHPVSAHDLQWADVVFVMEEKHKSRLKADFRQLLDHKAMHVLDIRDDYKFMQPELVEQLEQSVAAILGLD